MVFRTAGAALPRQRVPAPHSLQTKARLGAFATFLPLSARCCRMALALIRPTVALPLGRLIISVHAAGENAKHAHQVAADRNIRLFVLLWLGMKAHQPLPL